MKKIKELEEININYSLPKRNILHSVIVLIILLVILFIPFNIGLQLNFNRLGLKYMDESRECINQAEEIMENGKPLGNFLCECSKDNWKIPFRWDIRLAEEFTIFYRKEIQQNQDKSREIILKHKELCKIKKELVK